MSNLGPPSGSQTPATTRTRKFMTDERWIGASREWVTHILAIGIVSATIFCALWSFKFVGNSTEMEDAKALLAAMSGLSGVIVGYYFGRVPGEAYASRAQDQASDALTDMGKMKGDMGQATTRLGELIEKVAAGDQIGVDDLRSVRQMISPA